MENSIQLAINDIPDNCLELPSATVCKSLMSNIINNCDSHPNQLLACNDTRIAHYPLVLAKDEEERTKAFEEARRAEEQKFKEYYNNITNSSSKKG